MNGISAVSGTPEGFCDQEINGILQQWLNGLKQKPTRVLILPPDYTRFHSNGGLITRMLYEMLAPSCQVEVMIASGTHVRISQEQLQHMYAGIPPERIMCHDFRHDTVRIGTIPEKYMDEISDGQMRQEIPVVINRKLTEGCFDLILSVGQVIPHEVVGMSNYSKNIFVGCGGIEMINASHMLGALVGIENIMGKDHMPVRRLFDYAEEHFLRQIPLVYIMTVTDAPEGKIRTHGIFIGRDRSYFEDAVALSQKLNITILDKPVSKIVTFLDPREFSSTWVGNKSIYRTRMAIADQGELVVLAPGVRRFGEDSELDYLIRKYGYSGRENLLKQVKVNKDLQKNLSAAAHMIHGSSDGRFHITYCTRYLSDQEIKSVGYDYQRYEDAVKRYTPEKLKDGWNTLNNGEEIYFISNPALGLWVNRARLEKKA